MRYRRRRRRVVYPDFCQNRAYVYIRGYCLFGMVYARTKEREKVSLYAAGRRAGIENEIFPGMQRISVSIVDLRERHERCESVLLGGAERMCLYR